MERQCGISLSPYQPDQSLRGVENQGSGIDKEDSEEAKVKRRGKRGHSTTQGGFINLSVLETQVQNLR